MKLNINKILKTAVFAALCALSVSCSDWTVPERKNIDRLLVEADSALARANEAYYENLRAYKKTPHELTFGWFAAWAADGAGSTYLSQLPDSVDLVSLWGETLWAHPTESMLEDLRNVQEKKGTKVVIACLLFDIGKGITPDIAPEFLEEHPNADWEMWSKHYWGWVDGNEEAITASIEKYANALCDTIFKFGYDGFDLDAEPSYAQPFQTKKEMWNPRSRMYTFVNTMCKRIGPKAETAEGREKLFVVDGEPEWFPAEYGPYMNYFIHQTYGAGSNSSLEYKLNTVVNHFATVHTEEEVCNKYIVTEEFEKWGTTGGVNFRLPSGETVPSYLGMAHWKPRGRYRKGGIGSYHMQRDFAANPEYKYLRQGIQIMNPAAL